MILLIVSSNRKEINRKYNEKNPSVNVRMSQELKSQIPIPKASWIRKLIVRELKTKNRNATNEESRNTILKNSLAYLFNFLQKNASDLVITELEREEIIKILEVLKSE